MIKKFWLSALLLAVSVLTHADPAKMERDYADLAERFEVREKNLIRPLRTYLSNYPYTTYEDEVHFMIGVLQTENGRYKQALRELDKADHTVLSRAHMSECVFYRGYANLMLQEYERARVYFATLTRSKNDYSLKGAYYHAYCLYKLERYDEVLPELEALENVAEYKKTIPYYIVQIYYSRKSYDEVRTRAEKLLASQPDNENNAELHRMLGEIYYQQGEYALAIDHLQQYENTLPEGVSLLRNDLYLLGQAQYQTGAYESAVNTLKKIKQDRDTVSESACLVMGNAYRQLGQMEQAKLSYQAAMNYSLTPTLREEAMYNYTLTTYESSTALGESVTAFTAFLNEYPESQHKRTVYELMGDALRRSKNFRAALQTLDAISDPSPKMQSAKQLLRYRIGTDAFLQGRMEEAVNWMTEVINHPNAGQAELCAEARYWRAEAAYRMHNYTLAEQDVNAYLSDPKARQSANYATALYLRGYTYFSQKRYTEAETVLSQYVQLIDAADATYADALNRIADCSFNARRFEKAIGYYDQVIRMRATGSDYATFQKGYAEGLLRQYDRKIATMTTLATDYPRSDYADDALYEIARAQLQRDNEQAAIEVYEQLLTRYPNSNMARKSSLEVAMLYRNMRNYDKAIEAYKRTIDKYPSSEEAYAALDGLEATYVETNNISEYLRYTKTLSKLNMKVTTQDDSLSFAAAELQYALGNYKEAAAAMTTYMSKYCSGGRHCTTAQYYLADSYYRLMKRTEALEAYKALSDIKGNPYMEEACTRVAEISYDNADYNTAMDYFYRMLQVASSKKNADIARLGVLRCSYQIGNHQATIDIATEILSGETSNASVRSEAQYNRAKALIAQKQYGRAVVDLTDLSAEVRTAQGAEAKYLLAECYYRMKALDNAEAEIMAFAGLNTQHQYWLAKALILLSDINVDRGENFQARQYLLSLQANYKQKDDIQDIVAARLRQMDEKEKAATVIDEEVEE